MIGSEEAVARLRRVAETLGAKVEESPKNAAAAVALAEALFRLSTHTSEPGAQESLLSRACKLDPYDRRLRLALGRARRRAGDFPGAIAAFGEAAALDPRDARPWVAIGMALVARYRSSPQAKVKLIDRALEAFDRALTLDPSLESIHAAKLFAVSAMRVTSPDRSRLLKLLPDALGAIRPRRELCQFIGWLGLSAAFAAHFPKHLGTTNPADKLSEAERAARSRILRSLIAGLLPWTEAFADAPELRMARAAAAIFDAALPSSTDLAEEAAFIDGLVEAATSFSDRSLLHLVLHQKLEEIADPKRRLAVISGVTKQLPLLIGLDREVLVALNAAARAALLEGKLAEAEQHWRAGVALDPYNAAFHHNLALLALHQRDAAAFSVRLRNCVEIDITRWSIGVRGVEALDGLRARHQTFAARLRQSVSSALERADGSALDPEVIGAWLGETQAWLILGRAMAALQSGAQLAPELETELTTFVRGLPAIASPVMIVPPALKALLEAPLGARPPLFYDELDVTMDATPGQIQKRGDEQRERYSRLLREAFQNNNREAAQAMRRRLARIDEAASVLGSPEQRAGYDRQCLAWSEHELNRATRQFIADLLEFGESLAEKGRAELVPLLLRAYRQTPHVHLDEYFEARQPRFRSIIASNLASVAIYDYLERADEHMKNKRWQDAHDLLITALSLVEQPSRRLLYNLAFCELQLEAAYVEEHGALSAVGVEVVAGARAALEALQTGAQDA